MKVKQDTTTVATQFFLIDQFLGFSGSSGLNQVTYTLLFSVLLHAALSTTPLIPDLGLSRIPHVFLSLFPFLGMVVAAVLLNHRLYHVRLTFAVLDLEIHARHHGDGVQSNHGIFELTL